MEKGAIGAIAVALCLLILAAIIAREKCRLGNVQWQVCAWMGVPHAGGPLTFSTLKGSSPNPLSRYGTEVIAEHEAKRDGLVWVDTVDKVD